MDSSILFTYHDTSEFIVEITFSNEMVFGFGGI